MKEQTSVTFMPLNHISIKQNMLIETFTLRQLPMEHHKLTSLNILCLLITFIFFLGLKAYLQCYSINIR